MTVLAALQSATVRLAGYKPSVFFTSQQKLEQQLAELSNEVAIDIVKSNAWQALTKTHTITGDGVTTEFPLPSDYDRMLISTALLDTNNWAWGYKHIDGMNEWTYLTASGYVPTPGGWIIFGGNLNFSPAPASGGNATFPYISNLYAQGAGVSGAPKAAFDRDDDSFVLPERLLTLGLIWKYREQKRLDATGDFENFKKALSEYAGADRGPRVIRHGNHLRGNFSAAWPYPLGGL